MLWINVIRANQIKFIGTLNIISMAENENKSGLRTYICLETMLDKHKPNTFPERKQTH